MAEKKPKSEGKQASKGKQPSSYKELSTRRDALEKKKQDFFDKNDIESVVEIGKQLEVVNKLIEKRNKLNRETIYDSKEYDDVLKSIGGKIDKQSKGYAEIEKQLAEVDAAVDGIAQQISQIPTSQKEVRDTALDAAAAYKKGTGEIQNAFASLIENKDANIDIAKIIQKQIDQQKGYITELEKAGDVAAEVLESNKDNLDVLEKTKKAYAAAAKDMKAMGKAGEMLNNTPFGGMINKGLGITKSLGITKEGNVGDLTTNLIKRRGDAGLVQGAGGKAASGLLRGVGAIARFAGPAALIAGAAYGIFKWVDGGGPQKLSAAFKMIGGDKLMDEKSINDKAASLEGTEEFRKINAKYNYIKPLEERQTREKELFDYQKQNTIAMIEYENSLVKDELSYQIGLKKDAITFGHNQAMQTMEAEGARRKSLFLTGMTMYKKSLMVSERALNAIGSSTEAVFESIKEIGLQLGVGLSEQIKMATSAAGLSKTYGSSSEDVLKMTKSFKLMDKSSAKVAFNNVAGLSAFAKMNDLSPAQLFKQMADASEEVMKYSNMTTSQYASQAVLLSNMNSSMKDMAAASGTMVLNYKDSIKSEMSLSAMLGRNVNLSEVRARLMSGDMAGGASALKSALGGMDIGSMNAFQKQELSKATGMGVEQLMSLTQSKGGGVKGTLEERAGLKTGADIAKGALDMDVSLAGQRLGMEQAQRAEMLKFEQRERLIMMQLEQAQKLKMLEVEAYFRVKFTKEMEMSHEKQMAAAKHLEEMGSGIMMGGGKNLMDQAFRGLDGNSAGVKMGQSNLNSIQGMIQGNQIQANDMRLSEYYSAQFELAEKYAAQPDILAEKLEKTYSKIFKDEAAAQKAAKEKEIAAAIQQQERLINIAKAMDDVNRVKGGKGTDTFEDYAKRYKVSQAEMDSAQKLLNPNKKHIGIQEITSLGVGINKDALTKLRATTPTLTGPMGLPVPGALGPGGKPTTTPTGTPTTTTTAPPPPAAATNFGDIGKILERVAFSTNEFVKIGNKLFTNTNNTVIDLNMLYTKTSEVGNAVITNGNTTIGELRNLKTLETNAYTELLRRTDATNALLDTLIGATAEASAKPININGKRVSDVMKNVSQRVYGIAGA
jgi:hypothetical protein